MRKYVCKTCGYVYDPAVGDPDAGIEPGTPFETLPDDWSCPKCGSKKADFEPEDDPMPGIVAVPAGEENG